MLLQRGKPPTGTRFDGGKIVWSGAAIQALHSGVVFNVFNLLAVELHDEFGWSYSVLGLAFTLNRAESGMLGPLQGWMTDKWGPRTNLRLGAVVMAIGLLLFATVDSVLEFYGAYLLVSLGSSLAGHLPITVAIVHWYRRQRSKALAYGQMGFAVGGILAFLYGVVLNAIGWRATSVWAAALTLVVILPLSRYFHHRPSDVGQFVDGVDPAAADEAPPIPASQAKVDFTPTEAMRTRAFWFISLGHASALLVVGAAMAHLASFLKDEQGLSSLHTAVVVGVLPLMMGAGQLLGGVVGERMNKRHLVTIAMLGHGVGLLVLAVAANPAMVWLFVLLHGLAWGIRGPIQSSMRADYFGAADFGKIMGFSSLIIMLGMMIAPVFAGVLKDATGSFTLPFLILSAFAGAGSLWFFFATPPSAPVRTARLSDAVPTASPA
ncbi:MAG: MFS transporter [Acidimicrobiales bacterium]